MPVGKPLTPEERELAREVEFLEGLGRWAMHPQKPEGTGLSRLQLLENYHATMHLRGDWGFLDREKVRKVVNRMILDLKGEI